MDDGHKNNRNSLKNMCVHERVCVLVSLCLSMACLCVSICTCASVYVPVYVCISVRVESVFKYSEYVQLLLQPVMSTPLVASP